MHINNIASTLLWIVPSEDLCVTTQHYRLSSDISFAVRRLQALGRVKSNSARSWYITVPSVLSIVGGHAQQLDYSTIVRFFLPHVTTLMVLFQEQLRQRFYKYQVMQSE